MVFSFWVIASIVIPILLVILDHRLPMVRNMLNTLAFLAFLLVINVAGMSVYNHVDDGTIYMTTIHGLFVQPIFMISLSYLGVYTAYKIALSIAK